MTRLEPTRDVLFVKFKKGDERYVFCGDKTAENLLALLRVMNRFADDDELSFSRTDFSKVCKAIKDETCLG